MESCLPLTIHVPQLDEIKQLIHNLRRSLMADYSQLTNDVAQLQAEDGVVIQALNDLKNNADPAVQAAAASIEAEIAKVDATVQADDPSAEPQPAPAPSPEPTPAPTPGA